MQVRSSSRVGDLIMVIGMVGRDRSGAVVDGAGPQTAHALRRIQDVLSGYGVGLESLVRLRVYLTEIADWPVVRDEITRTIGSEWPPAVVVEVNGLVEHSMLVELEADAAAP